MAGSYDLGNLLCHISLDNSAFIKGMYGVDQYLNKLASRASWFALKMSAAVTAPLAIMGKRAVSAFAEFDGAITKAMAVLDETSEKTRQQLERTAITMSKTSLPSAIELAKGYYYLAQAGLNTSQTIAAMPTVQKLAVAGTMDLSRASEFLVQTQAALGLAWKNTAQYGKDMTRIADNLTYAAIQTTAEVEDFAYALANKGAAGLRLVNKELEEGIAVLMAFAQQGIRGEEAGEKLYITMRDMQRAAIIDKDAWERLNLAVYDSAGKMLPVADILGQLETRLVGMTDEGKRTMLMLLGFQDRSVAATQILLGHADAIRQDEAALKSVGGVMDMINERYLKSFASQLQILKNHFIAVRIEIGRVLAGDLMKLNDFLKGLTRIWEGLSTSMKKFIVHLGLIVAGIGPAAAILGGVLKLLAAFAGTLAFLLSPIGLITAAITLLALRSKGLTDTFGNTFHNLRQLFNELNQRIRGWTEGDSAGLNLWAELVAVQVDRVKGKFVAFVEYLQRDFKNAMHLMLQTIGIALAGVIEIVAQAALEGAKRAMQLIKTELFGTDANQRKAYERALHWYEEKYPKTVDQTPIGAYRAAGLEGQPPQIPSTAWKWQQQSQGPLIPVTQTFSQEPAFTDEFRQMQDQALDELTRAQQGGFMDVMRGQLDFTVREMKSQWELATAQFGDQEFKDKNAKIDADADIADNWLRKRSQFTGMANEAKELGKRIWEPFVHPKKAFPEMFPDVVAELKQLWGGLTSLYNPVKEQVSMQFESMSEAMSTMYDKLKYKADDYDVYVKAKLHDQTKLWDYNTKMMSDMFNLPQERIKELIAQYRQMAEEQENMAVAEAKLQANAKALEGFERAPAYLETQNGLLKIQYKQLQDMGVPQDLIEAWYKRQNELLDITVKKVGIWSQQLEAASLKLKMDMDSVAGPWFTFAEEMPRMMEDGFMRMVEAGKGWKEQMVSMLKEIYYEFVRIQFVRPFAQNLSLGFNAVGGGILKAFGFHTGGIAGAGKTPAFYAPAVLWEHAPKYHTGKNDEIAAWIKGNEHVLTEDQAGTMVGLAERGMGGGPVTVNVINNSGMPLEVTRQQAYMNSDQRIIDVVVRAGGSNGPYRRSVTQVRG